MSDKYLLTHQPCSRCGSSDGKVYYKDGGSRCYSCGVALKVDSPDGSHLPQKNTYRKHQKKLKVSDVSEFLPADLMSRGIPPAIVKMFGVKMSINVTNGEPEAWFFPYKKGANTVGYKARKIQEKEFYSVGSVSNQVNPFGWDRVSENGKLLIITEGEIDAMSATKLLSDKGKGYKVVSIPTGAGAAEVYIKARLRLFENFEKVIINFDMDDVGKEAALAVAKTLSPGQAYIMELPEGFKDTNDLLMKGKPYQYLDAINNAKEWKPETIVKGEDTWEAYANRPPVTSYPWPEGWVDMNRMTYGIRLSELDTFTSGTSAGKTQLMREIVYHLLKTTDLKIGIMSLEEPLLDTVESYLELELNKRISLPDVEATLEEKKEAWEAIFGGGRVSLYDSFGGSENSVLKGIRYLAKGEECQLIVVDHLHMLLDGKDSEKEMIERVMLKLKKLTQELNIWIGLVAHLKKSSGRATFEEGAVANLDDLKGSSAIKQLSNGVYVLSRDQQADDYITKNTTQLTVKKCRFTGRTGQADRLLFHDDTGRMTVLKDDDINF